MTLGILRSVILLSRVLTFWLDITVVLKGMHRALNSHATALRSETYGGLDLTAATLAAILGIRG